MSNVSYVRTEMLPEQAPPATSVGAIGWARENLFKGWFNSALTVLSLLAIIGGLRFILPWMLSPTWYANSLNECREILHVMGKDGHFAGACWGVIRDRWVQLLFGFYPSEFYWRPILAFVLMGVALAPVLFSGLPRKMLWFSGAFPFIFPWMLWGGTIWGPLLAMAGLGLGYLVFRFVDRTAGQLAALIAGVVVAILWWLFAVAPINGTLTNMIANGRIDSVRADLVQTIETLPPQIAELQAKSEAMGAELAKNEAIKEEILARYDTASGIEDGGLPDIRTPEMETLEGEFRAFLSSIAGPRADKAAVDTELLKKNQALSQAETLLKGIDELPQDLATIERLKAEAAAGRAALPASVAGLTSIGDVAEDVSKEDRDALSVVLTTESNILAETNGVKDVHSQVGLVGLEPVISRNFGGFMLSISIGLVAIVCSLPLGIVLALGRQSDLLIVKSLCVGFIEFIRGVPLITLLFVASTLLNLFLPPGTNFDIILRVMIMATLFASAYMAEVIRGGLAALPKGQYEGADSLGLDYWQAQRLIIMPQALKISIPGIVSTFIGLFKDTVLVSIIGLLDPLGLSNAIRADAAWNGIVWEIYGFIGLMFFVFCFSMSRYSMYLERKLQTGHR